MTWSWRLSAPLLLLLEFVMAVGGAREYCATRDVKEQCMQWTPSDEREECVKCITPHFPDTNSAKLLKNADLMLQKARGNAICKWNASSFPGVCKLWAEQCALVHVPPMPCLRHLRAPANQLADLRPLEKLPSLLSVDVSASAQLGPLLAAAEVFFNATELRSLNMSACAVRHLRPPTFEGLPKLEVLFLRSNELHMLSFEVFQPLRHLRVLDVSDNQLLHLSGNPHLCCLVGVNVSLFEDIGPALRNLTSPTLALELKHSTCSNCRLHDFSLIIQEATVERLTEVAKPVETTHEDTCHSADDYVICTVADWEIRCANCFPNGSLADLGPATTVVQQSVSDKTSFPTQITTPPPRLSTERNSKVLSVNSAPELIRSQIPPSTAATNLAVVVVSSVLSMLLVAQSVFVVFLLLRRRQPFPVEHAQEVPATWPVTDLDDDLVYSSLNPVYETIPEKP